MRRNYSLYKTERFVNFRQMLNGVEEKYGDRTAFMYKNGGEIKEKTYKEVWSDDYKMLHRSEFSLLNVLDKNIKFFFTKIS